MELESLRSKRFGRLTVQDFLSLQPTRWSAICDCGRSVEVTASNLKRGNTRSCGCLRLEALKARAVHSLSTVGDPTYGVWVGMRQRCWNSGSQAFKYYGAKGIEICPTWWWFPQFLLDMGERPEGLSLERVDCRGNYCKENCVWADDVTQANNKSNNRRLSLGNETKTLPQWARDPRCLVGVGTLRSRMQQGWDLADALFSPLLRSRHDLNKFSKTLVFE